MAGAITQMLICVLNKKIALNGSNFTLLGDEKYKHDWERDLPALAAVDWKSNTLSVGEHKSPSRDQHYRTDNKKVYETKTSMLTERTPVIIPGSPDYAI
ncbi:hypothetical protein B7764_16285 [Pantoea ananatis]|nr:hypothetical protein B7764_16285 [Pantoea ananatis]